MTIMIWILTTVHVIVALFLVGIVLMQKSQDQGVGAAFGSGVTDSVFGAGTTTALVRMTIWCACIMLGTTLLLAVLHSRRGTESGSVMQKVIATMPAPATQMPAMPSVVPPTTETKPDAAPTPAPAPAVPVAKP